MERKYKCKHCGCTDAVKLTSTEGYWLNIAGHMQVVNVPLFVCLSCGSISVSEEDKQILLKEYQKNQ